METPYCTRRIILLLVACLSLWMGLCPGPVQVQASIRKPLMLYTDDSACNDGEGCSKEAGFYCDYSTRNCYPCSPCPDVNLYLGYSSFSVVDVCIWNGFCPLMCPATMNLGTMARMNDSYCREQSYFRRADCELTCTNGGTLDPEECQCSCVDDWSGSNCSECSLTCAHGGLLDSSSCTCSCEGEWTGKTCSECGLTSCKNGGTLDLSSCQCACIEDWKGSTCTDCGLSDCSNGGYLDESRCWCHCQAGWTGPTCSVERSAEPVGDPTKTGGGLQRTRTTKGSKELWVGVASLLTLVLALVVYFARKKYLSSCTPRHDAESGSLLPTEFLVVEHLSPDSLSIRAKRCQSGGRRLVRMLCQMKAESGVPELRTSEEMRWSPEGCVSHTFGGLEAATDYRLALEEKEGETGRWKELAAAEATTSRYSLTLVRSEDGRSATVSGLSQGSWNALEVCSCLRTELGDRWLDIPPGSDTMQLAGVLPSQSYTVRAGFVTGGWEPTFRPSAEGTLTGDASSQLVQGSCKTLRAVLEEVSLVRSLELELRDPGQHYMPQLLASAFSLQGDQRHGLIQSRECLDTLYSYLNQEAEDRLGIPVHEMMEFLVRYKEAENFLWKLAQFTKCPRCSELLHQTHTQAPTTQQGLQSMA